MAFWHPLASIPIQTRLTSPATRRPTESLLISHSNAQDKQASRVLTDWNMPEKTGLDVIEAIRGQGSDVPIIMITTEAETRRVLDAIRAGVTDYLVKPFETDTLREKIGKVLPSS